jgi:DNA-binding NtrC family response regulator
VLTALERFLGGAAGTQPRVDLSLPFRDAKARIVEEFELAYVAGLLDAHGGKLAAAAKHADMDPKYFSDKMARCGLRRQAAEPGEGGTRAT